MPSALPRSANADSPWSLRALAASYATGWVCVGFAWMSGDTPTLVVPVVCVAVAVVLLTLEGGGRRSALALALIGLACGWLYVAPALGAALHAMTLSAEHPGMEPGGVEYGSALTRSLGHQFFAALAGTIGAPACFAAASVVVPRHGLRPSGARPSLVAPIHAAVAATIQAPAVFFALIPLGQSQWHVGGVGGEVTLGLAAIASVLAAYVALVVVAWMWVRATWSDRAEAPSFWITVFGTPLLSLLLWGMPLVVGLLAVQSVGAIVPLRGDAPPEGADPVIMHSLTRVFATWLLIGPVALANLWFLAAAARGLHRLVRRTFGF